MKEGTRMYLRCVVIGRYILLYIVANYKIFINICIYTYLYKYIYIERWILLYILLLITKYLYKYIYIHIYIDIYIYRTLIIVIYIVDNYKIFI